MHREQSLSRAPEPTSPMRRPTPGSARTSGLYGEVVTLSVNRRELAPTPERKVS